MAVLTAGVLEDLLNGGERGDRLRLLLRRDVRAASGE
jgi:hypothetical protein